MSETETDTSLRSWNVLLREASTCELCALHESRSRVVFEDGNREAGLVLIGEAPGRHEELQGRSFVGAVGNLLDNLLAENELTREDVYLTTLVKCRPPTNRDAENVEIETCSPYLREQLAHVQPKVVVALGERVTTFLLRRKAPIHRIAGYRFPFLGGTLIPTYDPATALRGNPHAMSTLKRDLRTAKGVLDGRVAPAQEALAELREGQGTAAT